MHTGKSLQDMSAQMSLRRQRLEQEQQRLNKKQSRLDQNPDGFSDPSETDLSRQAPKPKRRHNRSSNRSPFDDDSSLQFGYQENTKSSSSNTTGSTSPRQVNKFIKKPASIPVTTEKISVTRSPRDVLTPRTSARANQNNKMPQEAPRVKTGLLSQSSILARVARRKELYDKGIELAPGAFNDQDDDDSSSDATSTSGNVLFGANKKSFVKKTGISNNQVPDLQHLDSETNTSDRDEKQKKKPRKDRKSSSGDTEDDSSLDFIDDASSADGLKTPILTPRKGILKSPKDYISKENEHSVQFSEHLFTVQSDDERIPTPTKTSRNTTPRRVQIAEQPKQEYEESISSENESISTAIDIAEENDYENASFEEPTNQSAVENIFANMILNNEPILLPTPDKQRSPRRTTTNQKTTTTTKTSTFHDSPSDVSDDDSPVEEISEEPSIGNYSEDFTSGPTETSTPRIFVPAPVRQQKPTITMKKVSTDDQQVQVDLMSAPFQSSLNQVHSIYLINQNDSSEPRPSTLIRSVIEPHILESTLTTNPVILAVDDLIREQSSLLRSFIQLQRTYYESTIRNITPNHIYVTKDNTLQFIADQRQSRMAFQSNDDSIAH